jgi:hypothetical protein
MKGGFHKPALRQALRLLGAGVVLFHGKLLWDRWADGSLANGRVLAQWLAAALLVAGLAVVYRKQGRLFRTREAAVLWILVVLLHAVAGVPVVQMLATPTAILVLPLGLLAATILAGSFGRRFAAPLATTRRRAATHCPPTLAGHGGATGARAPPR